MKHAWTKWEKRIWFWSGNLKRRDHLQYLGLDGKIIELSVLQKQALMVWTGFKWLRIGYSSRLLWGHWTLEFHGNKEISWPGELLFTYSAPRSNTVTSLTTQDIPFSHLHGTNRPVTLPSCITTFYRDSVHWAYKFHISIQVLYFLLSYCISCLFKFYAFIPPQHFHSLLDVLVILHSTTFGA